MQLFYVQEISGDEIVLDETESRHAIKVLRLGMGSLMQLTDGKGGFYTAEISDPNPKKCRLEIVEFKPQYGKRNFYTHIAIAPTKNNDRLEWFLEKATEIAIDEVSLILCENSERKIIKTERLEKVAVSAMKQSLKAYLPRINNLISFEAFIRNCNYSQKFIAHCRDEEVPHLKTEVVINTPAVILIGPEGDFSPDEVTQAKMHGFREISLGKSRLRTETAGVVACHIVALAHD